MQAQLLPLRDRLAAISRPPAPSHRRPASLGGSLDAPLAGGLARAALHEVLAAAPRHASAASAFAAALALLAAGGSPLVWARQSLGTLEAGALYGPGLAELGLDPGRVVLVELKDALQVLRAALEAARTPALGAVVVEIWGEPRILDLTTTRRLALAAARSGTTVLLLRLGTEAQPSAAQTRWQVAASPSRALAANAPGHPSFTVKLDRHRAGPAGQSWRLEWNRDRHRFDIVPAQSAPLSGAVVSLPARQPAQAPGGRLAATG
ncbi:ImuA family protein [Consotaella aegiceratis]|uniref:ImuA family protein n=1 Tax=Consotaella aegiceratis TaxID=3097961 RepID=UPI002F3E52CF